MNIEGRLTPAQQQLVLKARPAAEKIVEKLVKVFRHVRPEDLRQMVYEGFIEAAPRHDPAQGPFEVFAWKRAVGKANEGAMREARHSPLRVVREAVLQMTVSDDDYDFYDDNDDPLIRLEAACCHGAFRMFFGATFEMWRTQGEQRLVDHMTRLTTFHALRAAFCTLAADEWRLLELHYIDLKTWTEVGEVFGVLERQARRRHEDICEKLRQELLAHGIDRAPPSSQSG